MSWQSVLHYIKNYIISASSCACNCAAHIYYGCVHKPQQPMCKYFKARLLNTAGLDNGIVLVLENSQQPCRAYKIGHTLHVRAILLATIHSKLLNSTLGNEFANKYTCLKKKEDKRQEIEMKSRDCIKRIGTKTYYINIAHSVTSIYHMSELAAVDFWVYCKYIELQLLLYTRVTAQWLKTMYDWTPL